MNKRNDEHLPAAYSGRRKLRNDIIFIAGLLLIVSIIGACMFLLRGDGDMVYVTVDGNLYGTYPLANDTRVEIRTGDDGEQCNVLVIRNGTAYVEEATCPDGICVAHRPISRDGESIACLPHRVAITVHAINDGVDMVVSSFQEEYRKR